MSIQLVREYLKAYQRDQDIIELETSSATVELAAQALGTSPQHIAKSLSFMGKENAFLIVCAGDAKVDNHTFKERFGVKAKMLKPEEVEQYTNHTIGGVCPFAVPHDTQIFLDVSLKRFAFIYPACGSANSAIKLTCNELQELLPSCTWVDVCKGWKEEYEV